MMLKFLGAFVLAIVSILGTDLHAGQVSVINPSGTAGTIGTVIVPVIVPPTAIVPSTPTPSTPTPSTPAPSTPTQSTSSSIETTQNVNNIAQAEVDLVPSTATETTSAPNFDSLQSVGEAVNEKTSSAQRQLSLETKQSISVTKALANQPTVSINIQSDVYSGFTSSQITQAIEFIKESLSGNDLTAVARQLLVAELIKLQNL